MTRCASIFRPPSVMGGGGLGAVVAEAGDQGVTAGAQAGASRGDAVDVEGLVVAVVRVVGAAQG